MLLMAVVISRAVRAAVLNCQPQGSVSIQVRVRRGPESSFQLQKPTKNEGMPLSKQPAAVSGEEAAGLALTLLVRAVKSIV